MVKGGQARLIRHDLGTWPWAVLAYDSAGVVRGANAAAAALCGRSVEQLQGVAYAALFSEPPPMEGGMGLLAAGNAQRPVLALPGPPDPEDRLLILYPLPTSGAAALAEELARYRARLAQVERIAGLGSWSWQPDSDRMVWSGALYRLLGLTPGAAPAAWTTLYGRLQPQERVRFGRVVHQAASRRRGFSGHVHLTVPGGESRFLQIRGHWRFGPQHLPLGMVGTVQDVTAAARTERALHRQLRRNELILQSNPEGFWAVDRSGRVREVNAAYCRMMGRPARELIGRHISELVEDRSVDAVAARVQEVLTRGEALFESRHRRHDGGYVDLEATAKAVSLGGETLFYTYFHDVTRRKAAAEALTRAAAEWNAVMDALDDAIYLVDLDDHLVRANRAFYRVTGLRPEESIGRDIAALVHPEGEKVPCPICRARRQRHETRLTLEADHPLNPAARPVEVVLRLVRDGAGVSLGMLVMMHDLSAAREAEATVRRLDHHVRLLLESAGEGIFGIDANLRCTFANGAAVAMLGYSQEELLAVPSIHALIHHSHTDGRPYPLEECPMYRAVRSGEATRTDSEVLWCRDGDFFPVEYSARPIIEGEAVTGAVVVFRNVTESQALLRKLDYLATHDTLTGLLNRHAFEERVQQTLERARVEPEHHVLCYLDLDQFKVINDTCGHVAGDELLRQIATLLHARIGPRDTLARLGGDEFGVLFEGRALDQGLTLATHLQETVRGLRFVWEEKTFLLGVSIGMVSLTAETESLANALSAADTACYIAKDSGRNRIHVHVPDDNELVQRRGEMQWVARIHDALEQDRFELRYQVIAPLDPARQGGDRYEILLVLRDAEGGTTPPGAFLPAAERFNLMPAIDRWVVHRTLAWLAGHPRQLARLEMCTVNLSGTTLGDESFLAEVIEWFRTTAVPPSKICFEITETAAIANLPRALRFIERLHGLGCRFALDDFGSGMSSFGYLRNLPVDFLKIDGNFVREMLGDEVDCAMVEAIHRVGHVMRIETIAEHLESTEVLELLREIGVDYGQGFRIAMPRPLAALA